LKDKFHPSICSSSPHPDFKPLITPIILIMNIRAIRGNQWKPAVQMLISTPPLSAK